VRTELKSATYHDLRLDRSAGRVWARIVIDV
jgi:SHS2 domain-containing protein